MKMLAGIKLCVILICVANVFGRTGSFIAEYGLTLKGAASGGTLVLAHTRNRNQKYISIQTLPGESAQSVVSRLADKINMRHMTQTERVRFDTHTLWVGGYQASASGDTLTLPGWPGRYTLAGTESGLGIPKPPTSLSCSYNKSKEEIMLQWINPPENYDFIMVKCFWKDFDKEYWKKLPGDSTSLVIDKKKISIDINDLNVLVIGFKDDIPSNAASIHLSGNRQEEIYGIPFTGNISPNWKAWSTGKNVAMDAFEQGDKYTNLRYYNPTLALSTKPFYQVIKGSKTGSTYGIYRKFMGLTPGHTYRIIAGLTTLDIDSVESGWSVSLCAAYNKGNDLSNKQLAGLATLPSRRSGKKAREIVSYGKDRNNTKGKFSIVCSNANSHVTLPEDANTITVWIRFNCNDPNGRIGFSGIKLEDITTLENVKSAEQIQQEEHLEEIKILNREKAWKAKK